MRMRGDIVDFLRLVEQNESLARDLAALAARYGFDFRTELSEEELEEISGGVTATTISSTDEKISSMDDKKSQLLSETEAEKDSSWSQLTTGVTAAVITSSSTLR